MSRDPALYLADIRSRCRRLALATEGKALADFVSDDLLHEACLRHLTVIGEAVKGLPQDLKEQEPRVEWRRIAGLRDILVHVYFGIKDEVVWEILQSDVPELERAVVRMGAR